MHSRTVLWASSSILQPRGGRLGSWVHSSESGVQVLSMDHGGRERPNLLSIYQKPGNSPKLPPILEAGLRLRQQDLLESWQQRFTEGTSRRVRAH